MCPLKGPHSLEHARKFKEGIGQHRPPNNDAGLSYFQTPKITPPRFKWEGEPHNSFISRGWPSLPGDLSKCRCFRRTHHYTLFLV